MARLQYDGGGDWYANPSSIPNLLTAIRERTSLPVERTEARGTLMDDKLWDYPFLHMTGHGNVKFTEDPLEETLKAMAEWTHELGMSKEETNVEGLVDLGLLKSLGK